jgi:hypothetical protein
LIFHDDRMEILPMLTSFPTLNVGLTFSFYEFVE